MKTPSFKFLAAFLFAACAAGLSHAGEGCAAAPAPVNPSGFVIHRGTNLSHWLSQDFGWVPKDEWLTQRDIEFIASCGFDHVRLPVDEFELWNEDGSPREENFARLSKGIEWSRAANLRVILDMHVLRSHHFNAANEGGSNTLFGDPRAQQHLADLWMDLSRRYRDIPVSELAYEIMNEPVADDNEQWNALVALVLKQIRAVEPSRVVVIGANRWQIPQNVPALQFPEGDKNIIISFHTYTPMLFTQIRQPETDYLVVPEVSSKRRKYVPIGFLSPDVIASNKLYIIRDATLYMFGILTSSMHMAWMRIVAGRLKSDYSYSPAVYNNFIWPEADEARQAAVTQAAQAVLDARARYAESTLADLYDPLTMPPELSKAHAKLDALVDKLYGRAFATDADRVAHLFALYATTVKIM